MDILTAIHTRRSTRAFTDAPVSEDHIKILLDAAMIAPSAGNAQPWGFIVIDDKEMLTKASSLNPYAGMAAKAPLGILVCGVLPKEKYSGFWIQDCSAAIQNILLAAVALGLGTVWTGIYPIEDRVESFRKHFSVPQTMVPLGLVVVGHPAVEQTRKSRYDETAVRRNHWS